MCGIIGYVGFQDPKGILLDGLKRLEYRGYDSAGIAIQGTDGKVELHRCEGRIQALEDKISDRAFSGTVGIGHTRWATHGAPIEKNAHPHRVGSITLVHNGIIENYMAHKEALLAMGREIRSDTDSEIVAHLFDLEVQKGRGLLAALESVLPRLKGSYAFVILNDREPDMVVGVRNGAPLLAGLGKGENYVASDVQAILHRTKQIIYLKDRQSAICTREGVKVRDESGREVTPVVKTIDWSPDQMEKGGYRHFMLKEIHEQSRAISQTIEGNINHEKGIVALKNLEMAPETMRGLRRISIVACGTARHAGIIGKYLIERFARVPVDVDFGSEFRYRDPVLDKDTLLILVSQSGETADTLAALREGHSRHIRTLAVCNVRESTLTREADAVIYTNAGPEIGVASTKAFTTQVAVLYMFAVQLGYLNGTLTDEQSRALTRDLLTLPILVDKTLQLAEPIEKMAQGSQNSTFFFYIARDVNYSVALEGALKLKEISYAHAEGYAAGEIKHGPIALIDRNTTVVVIAPRDKAAAWDRKGTQQTFSETIYEKVMSNLQEVKSRGARILSIGTEGDEPLRRESNEFLGLPSAPWGLNPILTSIPMQLFAYYVALQRGTDVDKPRNLAKSVTVE